MNGQWGARDVLSKVEAFAHKEPPRDGEQWGLWRDGYMEALYRLRDVLDGLDWWAMHPWAILTPEPLKEEDQ